PARPGGLGLARTAADRSAGGLTRAFGRTAFERPGLRVPARRVVARCHGHASDCLRHPSRRCRMPTIETEQTLFGDALACHVDLPATFCERASESGTTERAIARAQSTLHSIAL